MQNAGVQSSFLGCAAPVSCASSIIASAAVDSDGRADTAGPTPAASAPWDQRRIVSCSQTSATSWSPGCSSAQETLRRCSVRYCVGSDCPPARRPRKKAESGRGDLGADVDLERTPSAPARPSAPHSRPASPTDSCPGGFHGCCATSARTTSSFKAQSQAIFRRRASRHGHTEPARIAQTAARSQDCHLPLVSRTRCPSSSTCKIAEPPLMCHSGAWSGRRVLLAAFGAVFSAIKAVGRQSRTKTELRVELELLGVKHTHSGRKFTAGRSVHS